MVKCSVLVTALVILLLLAGLGPAHAATEAEALIFEDVFPFENGLAPVKMNGKWGYINTKGEMVIKPAYDEVKHFESGVALVKEDGKEGYIDEKGKVIVEPRPWSIFPLKDGSGIDLIADDPQKSPRLVGAFNRVTKELIPPQLLVQMTVGFGREKAAPFVLGGKYGVVNRSLKVLVSPTYEKMDFFWEGAAVFTENGLYGFIDDQGRVILPAQYEYLDKFSGGLAIFKQSGKYGLLNKLMEVVAPAVYDSLTRIGVKDFDFIVAKQNGRVGLFDLSGKFVVPLAYEGCRPGPWGLIIAKRDGKFGVIDAKGGEVIGFEYDEIGPAKGNFVAVRRGGKWGMVDRGGREVLDFIYDNIWMNNLKYNGKQGYFDARNGRVAVQPVYDGVDFTGETYWVKVGDKWGCLDKDGSEIIPPTYDQVAGTNGGPTRVFLWTGKTAVWGLVSRSGKLLREPEFEIPNSMWVYTHLSPEYRWMVVAKNGKHGFITAQGDWVGIKM